MIICKSVIKIKNIKEEVLNTFEIILNRNYENESVSQNVELIEIKGSERKSVGVGDYENASYYKYLKKLLIEHLSYEPNADMEYLIRMFRTQNALEYIDVERDSNPFSFTKEFSKIKFSILTYELNAKIAVKNILDLDNLVDLDEKSLCLGLNKYISNNVLNVLNKKIDLQSVTIKRQADETLEFTKINNIYIGRVYIKDSYGKGFKFEEKEGLKIFYIKGICRGLKYRNAKIRNIDFFEFDDGNQMFFIIDRGDVSKARVQELFDFDLVLFSGKLAIGVVTKREYTI